MCSLRSDFIFGLQTHRVAQTIEEHGLSIHTAVFHDALMKLLKDHTIQGRCLFPGAGFLEMALAAVTAQDATADVFRGKAVPSDVTILRDVSYLQPLDLKVGTSLVCEVQGSVSFRARAESEILCRVESFEVRPGSGNCAMIVDLIASAPDFKTDQGRTACCFRTAHNCYGDDLISHCCKRSML